MRDGKVFCVRNRFFVCKRYCCFSFSSSSLTIGKLLPLPQTDIATTRSLETVDLFRMKSVSLLCSVDSNPFNPYTVQQCFLILFFPTTRHGVATIAVDWENLKAMRIELNKNLLDA